MKNIESKTLENWIIELTEERKNYYLEKKKVYRELVELSRLIYKTTYDIEREVYRELGDKLGWSDKLREIMVDRINDNSDGVVFDREHYIKNKGNGPLYTVEFNGKTLYNVHRRGWTEDMRKSFTSWSIAEYYFYNYESKALYSLLESRKDLAKEANKEVDRYVKTLLDRIETRYGKVLNVKDTNLSNVETVSFECENGDVYLEKILAGGYNIQRLHNRILLKEVK